LQSFAVIVDRFFILVQRIVSIGSIDVGFSIFGIKAQGEIGDRKNEWVSRNNLNNPIWHVNHPA